MTGTELRIHCMKNFVAQGKRAKIVTVVGSNRNEKVTIRNANAYEKKV